MEIVRQKKPKITIYIDILRKSTLLMCMCIDSLYFYYGSLSAIEEFMFL